jgi:uncharacterized membrane protein
MDKSNTKTISRVLLGTGLVLASGKNRPRIGKIAATFFAAVFPGNIAQYTHHQDAFGLNSDAKRLARLAFQPLLIVWALKSTQNAEKHLD